MANLHKLVGRWQICVKMPPLFPTSIWLMSSRRTWEEQTIARDQPTPTIQKQKNPFHKNGGDDQIHFGAKPDRVTCIYYKRSQKPPFY